MGREKPITSFFFALGALAIIGLPPFAGFWSKLYVLVSVADSGLITAVILVLIASVIEAVYYLRVVSRLYFNTEIKTESEVRRTPASGIFAMGVLALVIIAVGIYPDYLWNILKPAAEELVNKAEYIRIALLK